MTAFAPDPNAPLKGVRITSLAINLPGPAALARLHAMGATCVKIEPPPPEGASSGDPCALASEALYRRLHEGIATRVLDLRQPQASAALHDELARSDVLLTSFRRRALRKLGVDWPSLQARHPRLCQVAVFGARGARADEPGHDLTYQAEAGLLRGTDMPASVFADMGGALMAAEAVLAVLLARAAQGHGCFAEVALNDAARWMALPVEFGLLDPAGVLAGRHAGYRIYACQDGRLALGAMEPHFSRALCECVGVPYAGPMTMFDAATHAAVADFAAARTCAALAALGAQHDVPMQLMRRDGAP